MNRDESPFEETPAGDEQPPAEDYLPEDDAAVSEFDLTPDGAEPTLDGGDEAADGDPALAALRAECDELQAKLLRTAADYQNYVRRSTQNLEATKQETLMRVTKALVGVLDNFDRALELDPETTSAEDLRGGVASIRASLLQGLEGFGFRKLDVEPGDAFDPNLHEALMRQPAEGVEPGHVAARLMPGYVLNDQPVRPAQVSVAE
ncbi:MAG: nucleotide exchange factor GrpE [Planctomycetota bacterium]